MQLRGLTEWHIKLLPTLFVAILLPVLQKLFDERPLLSLCQANHKGVPRMQSKATTPKEYVDSLPKERKQAISELRKAILKNLPKGFSEVMSYGMLGYVVPHSLYPAGYHCDPKQPLPFMCIASQKNFVAVYHMGVYANDKLLKWFTKEYAKHTKTKLDVGKSCMRFKKLDQIPYKLIGDLASKITPQEWIATYEKRIKK
jgi:hypothetical protein